MELVAPRAGYEVVDSIGTYQITPGGDWVTLNGTVQEVHSQLLKLNPNYDTDFPEGEADDGGSTRAARDLLDIDIGKTGGTEIVAPIVWKNQHVDCTPR